MGNLANPLHIGALLFEGFELLDFFGPLEMFTLLGEQAKISVLAERVGAIPSSGGPCGFATTTFADCEGFDVLLIPGGIGTRTLARDQAFLGELKRIANNSRIVATVCTGSFLLAQTGLLDGCRATSNKRVFEFVKESRPEVQWQPHARWVEEDRYFTSSGISAGIDMSLALIAKFFDRATATEVAQRAEYVWQEDASADPFAVDLPNL